MAHSTQRTIWILFIFSAFGFLIGISFPSYKNVISWIPNYATKQSVNYSIPKGAEKLPPKIIEADSDLLFRRLWGDPHEDIAVKPKYLVAFTVGYEHKDNIEKCMRKNFTVILFHYDGRESEWDEFEWSKRVVHVSALKQTKWWFAKRFMHPSIVSQYDYIFIWDEDLDVEHFDAEEYLQLVRKYGLEISQPGTTSNRQIMWELTRKQENVEIHKSVEEKPGWCTDPYKPPCAGFVEIMAPVFSREAWRCVWYLIQNDLVHGWGLDLAFGKCLEVPHEQVGVVDAQWVHHLVFPSLGNQGSGNEPWIGVSQRCNVEWEMFKKRLAEAENDVFKTSLPIKT